MGAGIGQIPLLREFGERLSKTRLERHRDGAESVESKIGYLASYARIAIHISEFSP
jgi:DNA-binding TFAR19-related protein (PDSD5 family)